MRTEIDAEIEIDRQVGIPTIQVDVVIEIDTPIVVVIELDPSLT